jgi:predicted transcriptional regulator
MNTQKLDELVQKKYLNRIENCEIILKHLYLSTIPDAAKTSMIKSLVQSSGLDWSSVREALEYLIYEGKACKKIRDSEGDRVYITVQGAHEVEEQIAAVANASNASSPQLILEEEEHEYDFGEATAKCEKDVMIIQTFDRYFV